jgi:hypothetical protein
MSAIRAYPGTRNQARMYAKLSRCTVHLKIKSILIEMEFPSLPRSSSRALGSYASLALGQLAVFSVIRTYLALAERCYGRPSLIWKFQYSPFVCGNCFRQIFC